MSELNDILKSFGLEQVDLDPESKSTDDVGVQNMLMSLIQQLYTLVDQYNTTAITCEELGYKDIANVCKGYAQDCLNKISYLQLLTQSLAPTVERVQNPFNGNEITII